MNNNRINVFIYALALVGLIPAIEFIYLLARLSVNAIAWDAGIAATIFLKVVFCGFLIGLARYCKKKNNYVVFDTLLCITGALGMIILYLKQHEEFLLQD